MVNWQAEKEIWEHTFFDTKTARKEVSCPDPGDTTLVLTEAPNSMAALQKNADEIIMEEWGFGGYVRCVGGFLLSDLFWRIISFAGNGIHWCILPNRG